MHFLGGFIQPSSHLRADSLRSLSLCLSRSPSQRRPPYSSAQKPPHPAATPSCSSSIGHHLHIWRPPRRMLPLGAPPLLSGAPLSQPGVQIYWSEHNRIRKWQLRAQFNLSVRDEPVFRPPKSWSGPLQATSSHNNGHEMILGGIMPKRMILTLWAVIVYRF
ncbi:hypothetical protein BDA96_10G146200 [Sorghum bicolor]|uniref:Uncharacterized protein n=1 Tax=Sorghum bicolor TaxID=4558 RepID=A0A921Q480_SORBI|nr:hypothetical protein BDA96_10G146200 [Sorghum bicolor]KAG0513940.1 hypothetical protein BDA96_10G146200 [Sorghum bicolor]